VGLLLVLWQGAQPLKGFAQGEQLNSSLQLGLDASLIGASDQPTTYDFSHPEVVLQLSRRKAMTAENYVRQFLSKNEEISAKELDRFSRLEFISAVLRSEDPEKWGKLADLWQKDEQLKDSIRRSNAGFAYMSRYCGLDWRGHWGRFQTAIDVDPYQHALSCARLRNLTISIPRLQQAAGSCSLIAGDLPIGLDFWKTTLNYHPNQTFRIAPLVGEWLDAEDLAAVLPESQLARTMLTRVLLQSNETADVGRQLLQQLDLPSLKLESETVRDWELVVWLSGHLDLDEETIEGLRRIAALQPMDKRIRVRLAKALEAAGDLDEAILQLEQASRRSTLNTADERYLMELKRKSKPPISTNAP
jgi:tetratricopeptide (TPR) repeat protein